MTNYRFKTIKKYYENKKRNEFYSDFMILEWHYFLEKVVKKYKPDVVGDISKYSDLFVFFPSRDLQLSWKSSMTEYSFYEELEYLTYLGVPSGNRLKVWFETLGLNEVLTKTDKALMMQGCSFENNLEAIYEHFASSIDEESDNSIFSLINNDCNFLKTIKNQTASDKNEEVAKVAKIVKSYFIWTDLFRAEESKLIYFKGLLSITQRLFSVYKNESHVFWLLTCFSEHLEIFCQTNPLYSNQQNVQKIYILIIKLILQNHMKEINNKFASINFPIEYFITDLLTNFYCDYFQTELFLRIMDIIVLHCSIKTNKDAKYDYLRLICAIPLTLIKENKRKILECISIKELETIFTTFVRKSFNLEKFIEKVQENMSEFYKTGSIFENFLGSKKLSWDDKRDKITGLLEQYFETVANENDTYLRKLESADIFQNGNYISNMKQIMRHKFEQMFIPN